MNRRAIVALGIGGLLAGCASPPGPVPPEPGQEMATPVAQAPGAEGTENAAKVDPVPTRPVAPTPTSKPPAPAKRPPVVASIEGRNLRAWAAKQNAGHARLEAAAVPKEVQAELLKLGAMYIRKTDKQNKKQPYLKWVRVLSARTGTAGPTVAFSYATTYDWGGEEAESRNYGVTADESGVYTLRQGADATFDPNYQWNEFSIINDRDVDGDGYKDSIVDYNSGNAGGGADRDHSMIWMGSKAASTLSISIDAEDSAYEGDSYQKDTNASVACWTTIGHRPAFILATEMADTYQASGGKDQAITLSVYAADDAGWLAWTKAYGVVAAKNNDRNKVAAAWKKLVPGKKAVFNATDKTSLAVACPGGDRPPFIAADTQAKLRCPDHQCALKGNYLLIVGLAFTKEEAQAAGKGTLLEID